MAGVSVGINEIPRCTLSKQARRRSSAVTAIKTLLNPNIRANPNPIHLLYTSLNNELFYLNRNTRPHVTTNNTCILCTPQLHKGKNKTVVVVVVI